MSAVWENLWVLIKSAASLLLGLVVLAVLLPLLFLVWAWNKWTCPEKAEWMRTGIIKGFRKALRELKEGGA